MSQQTPEKHMGTRCGFMLSAGGPMSYACELPQGHQDVVPLDPEPHYAVEVDRSVRQWREWKTRIDQGENQTQQNDQDELLIDCPSCNADKMILTLATGTAECRGCGATSQLATAEGAGSAVPAPPFEAVGPDAVVEVPYGGRESDDVPTLDEAFAEESATTEYTGLRALLADPVAQHVHDQVTAALLIEDIVEAISGWVRE